MSMNANSQDKEAAWLFLQWLTSKETMIKTHLGGNINPVRQSAWEDPEVAALVGAEPAQDNIGRSRRRWRRWPPCGSRPIQS